MDYSQKVSLKLNYHSNILLAKTPSLQNFSQAATCLAWAPAYGTAFVWNQLSQRECQWQRAYRRRPTALETE